MKKLPIIALSFIPLLAAAREPESPQPNIIFLLMDDLGIGEVGFNGQRQIETPNIDALAKSGKIMTQHYSGSPVSAPSRCVLLTGKHTGHSAVRGNDEMAERGDVWSHQAVFDNPSLEGQRPMPATELTIAHILRKAGYTTACIGKWGLGAPGTQGDPNSSGFDFFYGYNCQRQAHTYYPTHLWRNSEREILDNTVLQPNTKLPSEADPRDPSSYAQFRQREYAPDKMFAATLEFIDKNRKNPFFIWWTTPLPHVSLQAPEELIEYYVKKFGDEAPFTGDGLYFPARYPHATYAAMVTYIDNQVGELVAKLKLDGLYENTVIIFTSDNGPTFNGGTDSPWFDSARPYKSERGWGKCSLHEGGINVPTFVVWNDRIVAGGSSNHLSGFQDWFATIADIASIRTAPQNDGISMLPTLTGHGRQSTHEALYWEYPEAGGSIAVREGRYKLLVQNIRKEPTYELFDLSSDPREQNNIIAEHPDVAEHLMKIAHKSHTPPTNKSFSMGLPLSR